jgi:FixJ family two-component response regulator
MIVAPDQAARPGGSDGFAPACRPQVYVVDDEEAVRSALLRLLASDDRFEVHAHASAQSFLSSVDSEAPGCAVLDVALPGIDGLAVQSMLLERGCALPLIFLTGCADVPMCASAMRRGAVDFLTKPVDDAVLFRAIERAFAQDAVQRADRSHHVMTQQRLASLTPREWEVIAQVMSGRLNKQIAGDLGIAEKTVKVHRGRAMEKMRVRSVAELVRMVERDRDATDAPLT